MIVILAREQDRAAWALADHWSRHDARVMCCQDLSRVGWRHELDDPAAGTAVVGGRVIPVGAIRGVLTRINGVADGDLVHVVAGDRGYVAAEMTAFLRSWLTTIPCPALNRPSASSLTGPGWRPEQWAQAAARLGLPVRPIRRSVAPPGSAAHEDNGGGSEAVEEEPVTATVVGARCFGDGIDDLAGPARRLAEAAGVELLAVRFRGRAPGAAFLDANPCPDVSTPEVARAVAALLNGGTRS